MILADTSVWIDHFRRGNRAFAAMLQSANIATHPFIVGELACGFLSARERILSLLKNLPQIPQVKHDDVLEFMEQRHLWGKGIGYTDAHLLASAYYFETLLWTFDKRLPALAVEMGVAAKVSDDITGGGNDAG
jgi:predicted nucleic acid-binding protein